MKDTEFIELLNLYLDHEISAEDSARLEAEVLSHPQRRRTYQQYCRMQKACVVLVKEAAAEVEQTDRKIVAFEPASARSWGFGAYATGLCAAAACIALVFVARDRFAPPVTLAAPLSNAVAVAQSGAGAQDLAAPRAISRTVSVLHKEGELKPVFTAYTSLSESAARANPLGGGQDARFEWLNSVQISALSHLPAEDLVFRVKSGEALETRALSDRRAVDEKFERAAFQFQR